VTPKPVVIEGDSEIIPILIVIVTLPYELLVKGNRERGAVTAYGGGFEPPPTPTTNLNVPFKFSRGLRLSDFT